MSSGFSLHGTVIHIGLPANLFEHTTKDYFYDALARGRGLLLNTLRREMMSRFSLMLFPGGYQVTRENTPWKIDAGIPPGGIGLAARLPGALQMILPPDETESMIDQALGAFAEGFHEVLEDRLPASSENPSWIFVNPDEPNRIAILIDREEVESGETRRIDRALADLLTNTARVRRFRGQLEMVCDGYNADAREIYQIPEICAFYAKLDRKFPYWFWFVNREGEKLHMLGTLFFAARPGEMMLDGQITARFPDRAVKEFMSRHYAAVNELGRRFDLSGEEVSTAKREVEELFLNCYLGADDQEGGTILGLNPFQEELGGEEPPVVTGRDRVGIGRGITQTISNLLSRASRARRVWGFRDGRLEDIDLVMGIVLEGAKEGYFEASLQRDPAIAAAFRTSLEQVVTGLSMERVEDDLQVKNYVTRLLMFGYGNRRSKGFALMTEAEPGSLDEKVELYMAGIVKRERGRGYGGKMIDEFLKLVPQKVKLIAECRRECEIMCRILVAKGFKVVGTRADGVRILECSRG